MGRIKIRAPLFSAWIMVAGWCLTSSAAEEYTIRIGLDKPRQTINGESAWRSFQEYLNEFLKDSGEDTLKIEIVEGDLDEHLKNLEGGEIHGAMLSAFRYVVADVLYDDLHLIARLRRGGILEATVQEVESKQFEEPEPQDSYESVMVMKTRAGIWPPARITSPDERGGQESKQGNKVRFRFTEKNSTSSFIYPLAFLRREGYVVFDERGPYGNIQFIGDTVTADDMDDIWTTDGASDDRDHTDVQVFLRELLEDNCDFDVVATTSDLYSKYVSKEDRTAYTVIPDFHEGKIPFDALVIRESLLSKGMSKEQVGNAIQALQRAFTSTRTLSRHKRDGCFAWRPVSEGDHSSSKRRWRRLPDFYDWIPANRSDYDPVRRAAVFATGGEIVRMAVSAHVHEELGVDREGYFEPLARRLLTTKGKGASARRVFLDITYHAFGDISRMERDLRAGIVDLGEFPALPAVQLASEGFGLLATARYKNEMKAGEHRYKILTNKPKDKRSVSDVVKGDRFVCRSKQSMTSFLKPVNALRRMSDEFETSQVDAVNTYLGVYKLLIDGQADYGIVADYEERKAEGAFSDDELRRIGPLLDRSGNPVDGVVSNAMLVTGHRFGVSSSLSGPWFSLGCRASAVSKSSMLAAFPAEVRRTMEMALKDQESTSGKKFTGFIPLTGDDRARVLDDYEDFLGANWSVAWVSVFILALTLATILGLKMYVSWRECGPRSAYLVEGHETAERLDGNGSLGLGAANENAVDAKVNERGALSGEGARVHGKRHRVFIGHGHDRKNVYLKVDRFLTHEHELKTELMIEGPNEGRTTPEKLLESAKSCSYAVFVMTGDDECKSASGELLVRRPRQNVVLELGLFWGLVGKRNVAILKDPGIELPSNMSGILTIEITGDLGATMNKLAKELRSAGVIPA